ncbi:FecR family protein [Chitinophaga ginsengisoli]|uniref:FecR family protein n=1 Tax=Chitinophaga ginsengisoli TaxID=363837 RepID=A0A2P8FQM7_9BACT|nr:FecR family protein [Chitinophaga ginsengisoli]PSL24031.1 FecR family protein [Chitinophaga ginsengisoli]
MTQDDLRELIEKYLTEDLSQQEFQLLWSALEEPGNKEIWMEMVQSVWENPMYHGLSDDHIKEKALDRLRPLLTEEVISPMIPNSKPPVVRWLARGGAWWAAAVFVVMCCAGAYLLFLRPARRQPLDNTGGIAAKNDIAPGSNKALLTLSDGSTVALDSTGNQLIRQGATTIRQYNGQLQYKAQGAASGIAYNTLTTPRGGQFKIVLPDGTKVWLNAASSIRYPIAFTQNERRVKISGEVYFEVAGNATKPFMVDVNGSTEVQVLGTHFNINAYKDEAAINTTLLEGKVSVNVNQQPGVILKPGQQASLSTNGTLQLFKDVDTAQVVAWKEGWFQFHLANLPAVMRQVERWYDVEINYKGDITDVVFEGRIQRELTLAQMLKILEKYHVRFHVEGKTITVLPG